MKKEIEEKKTPFQIIDLMKSEMPFILNESIIPYMVEAMEMYAHQNVKHYQKLKEALTWRSIDDGNPEKDEDVLVLLSTNRYDINRFKDFWYKIYNDGQGYVTHWKYIEALSDEG